VSVFDPTDRQQTLLLQCQAEILDRLIAFGRTLEADGLDARMLWTLETTAIVKPLAVLLYRHGVTRDREIRECLAALGRAVRIFQRDMIEPPDPAVTKGSMH